MMEEWKDERVKEQNTGRMEYWKNGTMRLKREILSHPSYQYSILPVGWTKKLTKQIKSLAFGTLHGVRHF